MVKLAPAYIQRLAKANPAAYAREMGKVFMATIRSAGQDGMSALAAFNALYDIPEITNNPAAKKLLKQIADTINAVDGAAKAQADDAGGS